MFSVTDAPTPDRSVRLAWAADAAAIGAVQASAWTASYAQLLPPALLASVDAVSHAQAWEQALRRPPSARHRVLVALDGATVVGFAAVAPSEDPDADNIACAEIVALHVDPRHLRHGHGSRLVAAAVDTVRADGFRELRMWVLDADDVLRRFLESGGWACDEAGRTLDLVGDGKDQVSQVRLRTSVTE